MLGWLMVVGGSHSGLLATPSKLHVVGFGGKGKPINKSSGLASTEQTQPASEAQSKVDSRVGDCNPGAAGTTRLRAPTVMQHLLPRLKNSSPLRPPPGTAILLK